MPQISEVDRQNHVEEVNLQSLPLGTQVIIDTANSRYRVALLERPNVGMIEGGAIFPEPERIRMEGAVRRGGTLTPGWIGVGFPFECVAGGQLVLTSRIRDIIIDR